MEDEFFKFAFKLLLGGHNQEHSKRILYNLIESSSVDDVDYTKKLIQLDALLVMGEHPNYFVNIALFSYFGLSFKKKYHDGLKKLLPELIYEGLFEDGDFIFN